MWSAKINASTAKYEAPDEVDPVVTLRRIDRPHVPPAQLLLQQKPLIEPRANADHRGIPTAQRRQTIPVTLM